MLGEVHRQVCLGIVRPLPSSSSTGGMPGVMPLGSGMACPNKVHRQQQCTPCRAIPRTHEWGLPVPSGNGVNAWEVSSSGQVLGLRLLGRIQCSSVPSTKVLGGQQKMPMVLKGSFLAQCSWVGSVHPRWHGVRHRFLQFVSTHNVWAICKKHKC